MCVAAVAKILIWQAVSAVGQGSDSAHARAQQLVCDEGFKIEMGFMAGAELEKRIIALILGDKAVAKIVPDLVILLTDKGAKHGMDIAPLRAERFHRVDRSQGDARDRPAPACMARADHTCRNVCQQDRPAICAQSCQG
jgi:hypothetical protein